jgi:hypothetical protein
MFRNDSKSHFEDDWWPNFRGDGWPKSKVMQNERQVLGWRSSRPFQIYKFEMAVNLLLSRKGFRAEHQDLQPVSPHLTQQRHACKIGWLH